MDEIAVTLKDLVFLLGLAVSIGAPIIRLNVTIAKLMTKLDGLSGDINELTTQNSKSHRRIFDTLDTHSTALAEHDKRITVLEHEEGKR